MTSTQLFVPSWSRLNIWQATLHIQILPLQSSLLAKSGFVLLKNECPVPWQSRYLFYALFALCRLSSLFYPRNFYTLHWSGAWVKDFFIACACINFFANWKMFSMKGWNFLSPAQESNVNFKFGSSALTNLRVKVLTLKWPLNLFGWSKINKLKYRPLCLKIIWTNYFLLKLIFWQKF